MAIAAFEDGSAWAADVSGSGKPTISPYVYQNLPELQGRSPYDDVVQGEGEPDTRAPQQQYDERGRPINPETRRINRDVIRSHNEVMLVIGVAEPENGIPDVQVDAARKRTEYEDEIGMKLFWASDVLETAGVWGVNGMRQRILVGTVLIPFINSQTRP